MSILDLRLRVVAVPVLLGLGLMGFAVTGGQAQSRDGTVCGVNATSHGGMIALQAAFTSAVAVDGTYQFKVMSSGPGGSSNISQGGQFSAAANQDLTLGQVSINDGTHYSIVFTVNANGAEMDCSQALPSRS